MDKNIFKKIILEHHERIPSLNVIRRDYLFEEAASYIITGPRRAGKTYLLYQIIQDLLQKGIPVSQILYFNFEDERLLEMGVGDLDLLLESHAELFGIQPVIFLDEIQNIKGWQKFARRLTDSRYRVFLTGSNSGMLSGEMSSTLGGRFLVREIGTLSFREFLRFSNIDLKPNMMLSPSRHAVAGSFMHWFRSGGFPELIRLSDKRDYLSNLFQKVYLGDIVSRHQIRNPFTVKLLIKKLAESTMDEVSFNRIRHIIASAGIPIGTSTVTEYLGFLSEAFLISDIGNFESKISDRESKKKYYFRDHGLLSLFLEQPESPQLETIVANTLKARFPSQVYYLRNRFEVDFYVPERYKIQVCHSFSDFATRSREINGLVKANKLFPGGRNFILTLSQEEEPESGNVPVQVMPVWKWLLADEGNARITE